MDKLILQKATRKELVELLLEVYKENNNLKVKNLKLEEEVKKQTMIIYEKDSLGEIGIKLSGVFEVIEEAKKKYLENSVALAKTKEK